MVSRYPEYRSENRKGSVRSHEFSNGSGSQRAPVLRFEQFVCLPAVIIARREPLLCPHLKQVLSLLPNVGRYTLAKRLKVMREFLAPSDSNCVLTCQCGITHMSADVVFGFTGGASKVCRTCSTLFLTPAHAQPVTPIGWLHG